MISGGKRGALCCAGHAREMRTAESVAQQVRPRLPRAQQHRAAGHLARRRLAAAGAARRCSRLCRRLPRGRARERPATAVAAAAAAVGAGSAVVSLHVRALRRLGGLHPLSAARNGRYSRPAVRAGAGGLSGARGWRPSGVPRAPQARAGAVAARALRAAQAAAAIGGAHRWALLLRLSACGGVPGHAARYRRPPARGQAVPQRFHGPKWRAARA